MVTETSKNAYNKEVKPSLGRRQSEVLEALKKKENFTNAELAEFLRWPINTVTPRTNELVVMGYVEEACRRPCKATGRNVIAWRIKINPIPVVRMPEIKQKEWVFYSKTIAGKKYKVMDFTTYFACTCPAYDFRKTCGHIEQVKKMLLPPKNKIPLMQGQLF